MKDDLITNAEIEIMTGLSRSRINLLSDAGRLGDVVWKEVKGQQVRHYNRKTVELFQRQRMLRQILDLEGATLKEAQIAALERVAKELF